MNCVFYSTFVLIYYLTSITESSLTEFEFSNFSKLLDDANYDKQTRPSVRGPPDMVQVYIDLYNIARINHKDLSMEIDFSVTENWHENRILMPKSHGLKFNNPASKIWTSNLAIQNGQVINLVEGKGGINEKPASKVRAWFRQ